MSGVARVSVSERAKREPKAPSKINPYTRPTGAPAQATSKAQTMSVKRMAMNGAPSSQARERAARASSLTDRLRLANRRCDRCIGAGHRQADLRERPVGGIVRAAEPAAMDHGDAIRQREDLV